MMNFDDKERKLFFWGPHFIKFSREYQTAHVIEYFDLDVLNDFFHSSWRRTETSSSRRIIVRRELTEIFLLLFRLNATFS